ncbi:hypothetical protein BKH41_03195 [Helicobacter sp. 12S02232-10]|uniref:transglutaminase-like domain-containing protein n=1 Tax=Helicobacter sp. 12S02232-10 TaxID=1476197 RepID=UPI000BA77FEA|nr:transglutaminase-like domain-containing protein [Helicobacter sp. 12S02232-10]PAF49108.1 hypothetical protein BKH41_03195 [Helicobacter sp. 12S02232-10]
MKRRDFIKTGILGTGILMSSSILNANTSKTKKVSLDLSYQINFDSAQEVKLWIPMPITADFQQPSKIKIQGNYDLHKTYSQNGVPIVYAQYNQEKKPKNISIQMDLLLTQRNSKNSLNSKENLQTFLHSTRYIRTDGSIKELALKLKTTNDQQTVQNIYAWIKNNLDYQNAKNMKGIRKIQTKDSKVIFSGENISATTLFVSLCRACGIPSKEAFGLDLNHHQISFTSKAEVYLKQKGWVPYDVIAPIKNPTLEGSQQWLGNFVLLNYERDIKIEKSVLNSFDNAFALVDGDKLSYYESKHFIQNISYKQLS